MHVFIKYVIKTRLVVLHKFLVRYGFFFSLFFFAKFFFITFTSILYCFTVPDCIGSSTKDDLINTPTV